MHSATELTSDSLDLRGRWAAVRRKLPLGVRPSLHGCLMMRNSRSTGKHGTLSLRRSRHLPPNKKRPAGCQLPAASQPLHSFHTRLAALGTRCRNRCRVTSGLEGLTFYQLTEPTPLQQRAFQLLGLVFPVYGKAISTEPSSSQQDTLFQWEELRANHSRRDDDTMFSCQLLGMG